MTTPWIFKHGTNTVDRGLKALFFGLFAIFRSFFRYGNGVIALTARATIKPSKRVLNI